MLRVLILLTSVIISVNSANILAIFPTASISHQVGLRALTDGLEDAGHTLTIISTDPKRLSRRHPNTTEIDLNFSYELFRKSMNFVKIKESKMDELSLMDIWTGTIEPTFQEQFDYPPVKKLLESRGKVKFDAIIVEHLMYYPWFALADWFDAPLIGVTTLDMVSVLHAAHGNDANPGLQPDFMLPFIENLSFAQRFRSLKFSLWYEHYYKQKFLAISDRIIEKFMPDLQTKSNDLQARAELILTNAHPALGFIRPILPTTVQIGFMHIKPPKPITNSALKSYFDNSDKPIIYMSLGSNVRSSDMSESNVRIFLNVFKNLPFNVMWKWETDEMKNKPDNVFVQKWFPQADVLAHPKIKMFITQGGQQSMEEAIDRMVPLIVIPFMGDQEANAARVKKLKIGFPLELHTLNEKKLTETINAVANGEFKANIVKLREIVNDEPMKPIEKAVWWVEYCIRHKGMKHLDYSGKYVPFYKKYFLDFIGIILIGLFIVKKVLNFIFKKFIAKPKNKKD